MSSFVIRDPHTERATVTVENTGEIVVHDAFALHIVPRDREAPSPGEVEIDAAYQGKLTVAIRVGELLLDLTVTRDQNGKCTVQTPIALRPVGMFPDGTANSAVHYATFDLPDPDTGWRTPDV